MLRGTPLLFQVNHLLGIEGARTRLSWIINVIIPRCTHLRIAKRSWKANNRFYTFKAVSPCNVHIEIKAGKLEVTATSGSHIVLDTIADQLKTHLKIGMRKNARKK